MIRNAEAGNPVNYRKMGIEIFKQLEALENDNPNFNAMKPTNVPFDKKSFVKLTAPLLGPEEQIKDLPVYKELVQ